MLGFVSEFLGNVPEETRQNMCSVTKMEHYKKDETIFNAGDEPDKFYIILTGKVEMDPDLSHRICLIPIFMQSPKILVRTNLKYSEQ